MFKRIFIIVIALLLFPVCCFAEPALKLSCKSAILMEESTGKILYEYNSHEKIRPASVTKVMTLLLIMEALEDGKIKMEDMVPCSEHARKMGGSQIWLDERETLSVNDMLKAICVVSANDCSVAMAEYIGGSEEGFVDLMNKRASGLKMYDTNFVNCHGIDEDGHVTSAHDIAIMSRELIKHKKIFDYTTIWMDTLRDGKSQLVNTNKMIRFYSGANGLKTGSTSLAKYNLSVTAKRGDLQLIGVIMSAPTTKDRFADATKLLDYGFAKYEAAKLDNKGTSVGEIKVDRGEMDFVEGIIEKDVVLVGEKGIGKNLERRLEVGVPKAPIRAGEKLGDMVYIKDGIEVKRENVVAKNDVKKITFGKRVYKLINVWFCVGR